jgi:hypothetical protein
MPSGFHFRQAPFRAGSASVRAPRSGYFEGMARPGRTESESVPIWLKLSEDDAAQMEQVLARPEFAGWTKAEWCLEIIQTALRYYTKRPVAEPGRTRPPARPAATEPEPPPPAREPSPPAPEPSPPAPEPELAAPEPESAPRERGSPPQNRVRAAPKRQRAAPKRERAAPKPLRADPEPEPEEAAPEPEPVAPQATAATAESPPQPECLHPADARDYQTGTCAVCGAILWD